MKIITITFLLVIAFLSLSGQHTTCDDKSTLVTINNIEYGCLSNGFSYYIKHDSSLQQKVRIDLFVKAGENNESTDQLEVAHFVEHLPYSGNSTFGNPFEYFRRYGLKPGVQMVGITGIDRTVYHIEIPSSDPLAINDAFLFLKQCAEMTTDSTRIERERGPLIAELLRGTDGVGPILEYIREAKALESVDEFHAPVNKIESVRTVRPYQIRKFVRDWYTPSNMGIIIQGDLTSPYIKTKIIETFGNLEYRMPSTIIDTAINRVATNHLRYVCYVARQKPKPELRLYFNSPTKPLQTIKDTKVKAFEYLFNAIAITRKETFPKKDTLDLQSWNFSFNENANGYRENSLLVQSEVPLDSVEQSISASLFLCLQIKNFGFSEQEFETAKKMVNRRLLTSQYGDSDSFVSQCIEHALYSSPIFTQKDITKEIQNYILNWSLENFNSQVNQLIDFSKCTASFSVPTSDLTYILSEEDFKELLSDIINSPSRPSTWRNKLSEQISLFTQDKIDQMPIPRYVKSFDSQTNITSVLLDNGVKVFLKPMKESVNGNVVTIVGQSYEDNSRVYCDENYYNGLLAATIGTSEGVSDFTSKQIDAFSKSKGINVGFEARDTPRILGMGKQGSLQSILQLLHLKLTAQRFDSAKIAEIRESQIDHIRSEMLNDQNKFYDTIAALCDKSRTLNFAYKQYLKTTSEQVKVEFENNFSPINMFAISGSFSVDSAISDVARYLGNIKPSKLVQTKNQTTCPQTYCYGSNYSFNLKSNDDYAFVVITVKGVFDKSKAELAKLSVIKHILQQKLFIRLREKEGGVYVVNTNLQIANNMYTLSVTFRCDPLNVARLRLAAVQEIENTYNGRINSEQIEMAKNEVQIDAEMQRSAPLFWCRYILDSYNARTMNLEMPKDQVTKITQKQIIRATNKYLDSTKISTFVNLPTR